MTPQTKPANGGKPNLVMGAALGLGFKTLRPFVISLRRAAFAGDFVLLWNSFDEQTLVTLREHGVNLRHFSNRGGALNTWSRFWPVVSQIARPTSGSRLSRSLLKAILPMQSARFFHYRDYLEAHGDEYQNVLITDVRDVIFQADPFLGFDEIGHGVFVFEESGHVLLADEKQFNAEWVKQLFGPEALAQIGHHPILCSGTIMGEAKALVRYLAEFEKTLCQALDVGMAGSDQGVHNYLCRGAASSTIKVCKNGAGAVLTMVPTIKDGVDYQVSETGEIRGLHGGPISVLHQYDRHPELAAQLVQRLAP